MTETGTQNTPKFNYRQTDEAQIQISSYDGLFIVRWRFIYRHVANIINISTNCAANYYIDLALKKTFNIDSFYVGQNWWWFPKSNTVS